MRTNGQRCGCSRGLWRQRSNTTRRGHVEATERGAGRVRSAFLLRALAPGFLTAVVRHRRRCGGSTAGSGRRACAPRLGLRTGPSWRGSPHAAEAHGSSRLTRPRHGAATHRRCDRPGAHEHAETAEARQVAKEMASLVMLVRSKQLCVSDSSGSLPPVMHDAAGSGIIG
jgi:hypothetical protein